MVTISSPSLPAGSLLQLRARAELERRRRAESNADFARYQFDAAGYIQDKLGWTPWDGTDDAPGQLQVIHAYERALRQQHERDAWEQGAPEAELTAWRPGQVIQNRIRVEAGHTVGKTKLSSGLVNHFFDCFTPSIIYTFAPSWDQIHDLLWKEIKADRTGKGLPGRILDLRLDRGPNHFATGRATDNSHGTGTERVQGQHGKYLLFVLDEAEGIADFVFDAIDSMASGGISIVLLLANPRTRSSRFHKAAALSNVASFRVSCLFHPNVTQGREVVPGAVRREYVETMIEKHCEAADAHDDDAHTFTVPWRPDVIYRPDTEFLFRVLGIAPANVTDNTFVPVGRYEAACQREQRMGHPQVARMGVDVARYGKDVGTLYVSHNGRVWRAGRFAQQDTTAYAGRIKDVAKELREAGVTSLHIRVDGGGGFGGGVIDQLAADADLARLMPEIGIFEVHFGGTPYDWEAYADLITEMYAAAADALQVLRVDSPSAELEADLCERTYKWVHTRGVAVKRLEPKEDFKKRVKRSPDDGDGFVLAVAPDYLFLPRPDQVQTYDDRVEISPF